MCWDVINCPMWNTSENPWFSVDTVWELKGGLVANDWLDGSRTGHMRGFGWYRQVLSHRNQRAPVIAWEMPSSALQQLFPSHTHTPVTVIYCTLIYTLTNRHLSTSEICMLKYQMKHTFSLTNSLLYLTIPVVYFEWTFIEKSIFCSVTEAGLYLAVFIDSGLTHYTVLFSISQIHCESPDTPHKKEKEREREKWKIVTKQHSLIDSICNWKEIAVREMYFFISVSFPPYFIWLSPPCVRVTFLSTEMLWAVLV